MIDFLQSFKTLVKVETIHIDNYVFKCHYKLTVIMLIVFSIMLTSKQYFGEPIECQSDGDMNGLNTYCWIEGIYTLKTNTTGPLRGLGNSPSVYSENRYRPDKINHYKYYQYVSFLFCMQALVFYLPRYLWKNWEQGLLKYLLTDLIGPVAKPNWTTQTKDMLVNYLLNGKYPHNKYALRYCFCEFLNLLNVIGQLLLLDWFLLGNFLPYGVEVMNGRPNSISNVFPLKAKCNFDKYGVSGTKELYDALCILPLNALNEKIFLVIWFWLFFLLIISSVALIYRIFVLAIPRVRVYLLLGRIKHFGINKATVLIRQLTFGDFFILHSIGKNINPVVYGELLNSLYDHVRNKKIFYDSTRIEEA